MTVGHTGSGIGLRVFLIVAGVVCFAFVVALIIGIIIYPMEHRSEGFVLLFMAVLADVFLMGLYGVVNIYAKKFLLVPDIIASFVRLKPRLTMQICSAVLLSPVVIALARIALFRWP